VPTKVICTRSSKKAKWYTRHIRRALAKKRQLWRPCRKSRTIENRSLYDKQSALVKKLIYDREKQVEQSVINKNLAHFTVLSTENFPAKVELVH